MFEWDSSWAQFVTFGIGGGMALVFVLDFAGSVMRLMFRFERGARF